LKQEYKNGIAAIRSRVELDVLKNVQMSQVEGVDVLCNGDVLSDIEKNTVAFCITSKKILNCHVGKGFGLTFGKLIKVTMG